MAILRAVRSCLAAVGVLFGGVYGVYWIMDTQKETPFWMATVICLIVITGVLLASAFSNALDRLDEL